MLSTQASFIKFVIDNHVLPGDKLPSEIKEIPFDLSIKHPDFIDSLTKAFVAEMNENIRSFDPKTSTLEKYLVNVADNYVLTDPSISISLFDVITIDDKSIALVTGNGVFIEAENLNRYSIHIFNLDTIKPGSYVARTITNHLPSYFRWKCLQSIPSLNIIDITPATPDNLVISDSSSSFNESQQNVIYNMSNNHLIQKMLMVQGPPGTGKTRTSIEGIKKLLGAIPSSEAVLYTSTNNHIIEKVFQDIDRIEEMKQYFPLIVGNVKRVGEHVTDRTLSFYTDKLRRIFDMISRNRTRFETHFDKVGGVNRETVKLIEDIDRDLERFIPFTITSSNKNRTHIKCMMCKQSVISRSAELPPCRTCTILHDKVLVIRKGSLQNCIREMKRITNVKTVSDMKINKMLNRLNGEDTTATNITPMLWNELLLRLKTIMIDFGEEKTQIMSKCILDCSRLILCTTSIAGSGQLNDKPIHYVVVEEAGQTILLDTLMTLTPATRQLFLVGDQKQLNGLVMNESAQRAGLSKSMMDYLHHHKTPYLLLDTQYRMSPEISNFPNNAFYDNKVSNGSNTKVLEKCIDIHPALVPYRVLNLVDTEERFANNTYHNEKEMIYIQNIIFQIQEKYRDFDFRRITIVSPYNGQVNLFRSKLGHLPIDISTIDSIQGNENDIVLISLVRTSDIGFVKDQHRLNVLLTRAKQSLLVIGNISCHEKHQLIWKQLVKNAKYRRLYNTISYVDAEKTIVATKSTNDRKSLPNQRTAISRYNSAIKYHIFDLLKKYTDRKDRLIVLDLAIGNGGDIGKYISKYPNIDTLIGVDIDENSIKESIERHKTFNDGKCSYSSFTIDLSSNPESITKLSRKKYDLVSCQFAFHYFCKSPETIDLMIKTIASVMKKESIFTLTFPDGHALEKFNGVDNDTWSIEIEDNRVKYCLKKEKYFMEGSRVSNEFLAYPDLIIEIAKKYGLHLVEMNHTDFLHTEGEIKKIRLSKYEKDVVSTNVYQIFQKK